MEEGIKVLYVDDEPGLLEIARLFLEQSGNFQVSTALLAKTALDSPQIQSYDLILSDYLMPEMDGIAFLKEVRKRYGDIPFILFTGRGREEVVIEAINNGVDFYVQKGGDPAAQFAELAHKIRQAVLRKRAEHSRMKAERDLRESEEKYRSLVNLVPDAVLVHRNGTVVYANPECVRLVGADTPDDLVGLNMMPFIHPDDRPRALEHLRLMKEKGVTIPLVEERLQRLDGRPFTVEVTARPVIYQGLPSVIVVFRDITDRKKKEDELRALYEQITAAEEELRDQYEELARGEKLVRESQEQLRTFMDSATDAFAIWDADLNLIDLNDAGLAYLPPGMQKEEVIGRNFRDFVSDSGEWGEYDRYREVITTGIPFNGIEKITDTQHGRRWLNVRCFRVGDGLGILTSDITREKEAEEKLRESEENYRSVIINAPYGMHFYEMKPGRGLVFCGANPGADRILGISHDQFMGKTIEEAFPGLAGTEVPERYREAAESGSVWQTEQVNYNAGSISGAFAVTAFRTAPGAMAAMFVDITGRKRTEQLLKDSEERSRKILEQAPFPLAYVRNDGLLTFVNNRFVRVFGYKAEDIPTLEAWWLKAYPDPDYRQRVKLQWEEAVWRSLEGHTDIQPAEYRVTCNSGEERIIEVSGIAFSDGFLSTFIDRTGPRRSPP